MTQYAQMCIARQCAPLQALEVAVKKAEDGNLLDLGVLSAIPQPHFDVLLEVVASMANLRALRLDKAYLPDTQQIFALTNALRLGGVHLAELCVNCDNIGAPGAFLLAEMVGNGLEVLKITNFAHLTHFLACVTKTGLQCILSDLAVTNSVTDAHLPYLALLAAQGRIRALDISGARLGRRGAALTDFVALLSAMPPGSCLDIGGSQLSPMLSALLPRLRGTGMRVRVLHGAQVYSGDPTLHSRSPAQNQAQGTADSSDSEIMNRVLTVEDLA